MKTTISVVLVALLAGSSLADSYWRRYGNYNDDYDSDNYYGNGQHGYLGYSRHGYLGRSSYYPMMYRNYYSRYYRPQYRDWDDDYSGIYGNYRRYGYHGNYGRYGYMTNYYPSMSSMRYVTSPVKGYPRFGRYTY